MDLETISCLFDKIDDKILIIFYLIIKTELYDKIKDIIEDGVEFSHINKYVKFDKEIITIVERNYKQYNIIKHLNDVTKRKIYDIIHDHLTEKVQVVQVGGTNTNTLDNSITKKFEDKTCKGIIESKNSKRYKEICGGKGKTKINGEWYCGYHNKK